MPQPTDSLQQDGCQSPHGDITACFNLNFYFQLSLERKSAQATRHLFGAQITNAAPQHCVGRGAGAGATDRAALIRHRAIAAPQSRTAQASSACSQPSPSSGRPRGGEALREGDLVEHHHQVGSKLGHILSLIVSLQLEHADQHGVQLNGEMHIRTVVTITPLPEMAKGRQKDECIAGMRLPM